jgi:SAM-dependent methyltransferase
MTSPGTEYVFENAWQAGRDRLAAAEELLDPGTIRHLESLGVSRGWRCLEVGAGGGSVARWLCDRVGSEGHVTATDIDTRFLDSLQPANLEVMLHDVSNDALPLHAYDLVHARLVLEHLPQRRTALARLTEALRPGGWLLIEAVDYVCGVPISERGQALHRRVLEARLAMMREAGLDPEYGRTLPDALRSSGLVGVGAEGRVWIMEGGSPAARWFQLSLIQLGDRLVQAGGVEAAEVGEMVRMFNDPEFAAWTPVIVAAWGQSPEGVSM